MSSALMTLEAERRATAAEARALRAEWDVARLRQHLLAFSEDMAAVARSIDTAVLSDDLVPKPKSDPEDTSRPKKRVRRIHVSVK